MHYRGGTGGGSAVRSDYDVGAVRGAIYDGIPHWTVRGSGGPGYGRTVPVAARHGMDQCCRAARFRPSSSSSQSVLAER